MHRERDEEGRHGEGRRGEGRHRARGGGARAHERFEQEQRFRQRTRGPGSWAGLHGDYGQQQEEPFGYGEPERFGRGRFEEERFGERPHGGRGRYGRGWAERGFPPDERDFESEEERRRFGGGGFGGGGFDDRPDWQQPRFLSGSYDTGARAGFGPEEQEAAWQAGGAAERPGRGGPHVGKGPKGYRRSDERILDDVCETLEQHPRIDASDVEVSCSGGEITLRGTVDSRHTRRLAEEVIENLPGVRDVHNELRAQPHGGREERQHGASEPGAGRFVR